MPDAHRCPACLREVTRRERFCTHCWPELEIRADDPSVSAALVLIGVAAASLGIAALAGASGVAGLLAVVLVVVVIAGRDTLRSRNGNGTGSGNGSRRGNGGPTTACTSGMR